MRRVFIVLSFIRTSEGQGEELGAHVIHDAVGAEGMVLEIDVLKV